MSNTLTSKLKTALDETTNNYEQLWYDIKAGKLSVDEIKEKHKGMFEATEEVVDKILKLPEPAIVIEMCEGVIQDVYTHKDDGSVEYVVFVADEEFDVYQTHKTKTFKDYGTVVEDLEASYITMDAVEEDKVPEETEFEVKPYKAR